MEEVVGTGGEGMDKAVKSEGIHQHGGVPPPHIGEVCSYERKTPVDGVRWASPVNIYIKQANT